VSKIDLLISKVEAAESASNWGDAAAILAELVEVAPTPSLLLRYAIALDEVDNRPAAEAAARRAISLQPVFPQALFFLGILFEEQGRLVDAKTALETGIDQDHDPEALILLASVLRRLGDKTTARRRLEEALAMDPKNDEAHFGLGLVLKDVDPSMSLHHLRQAAELDPTLVGVERELGLALWRAKEYDDAEVALREAIRLDGRDGWAHDFLGHLLLRKGEAHHAKAEFEAAIESDPSVAVFYCNLAEASASIGLTAKAEALFLDALSRDAGDPYISLKYAFFLKAHGRLDRAGFYFKRTLSINPADKRARKALDEMKR
jgi:tetratricopeptide (TPR) repeat protein